MKAIRGYLKEANWPNSAIREELFSSKLDEEGKAQKPVIKRAAVQLASGITPAEHDSFDVGSVGSVAQEAEAFLKQCYLEQGLNAVFLPRCCIFSLRIWFPGSDLMSVRGIKNEIQITGK